MSERTTLWSMAVTRPTGQSFVTHDYVTLSEWTKPEFGNRRAENRESWGSHRRREMLWRRIVCHDCLRPSDQLGGGKQRKRSGTVDCSFRRQDTRDLARDCRVSVGTDDGNSKLVRKPLGEVDVVRPPFGPPRAAGRDGDDGSHRVSVFAEELVDLGT